MKKDPELRGFSQRVLCFQGVPRHRNNNSVVGSGTDFLGSLLLLTHGSLHILSHKHTHTHTRTYIFAVCKSKNNILAVTRNVNSIIPEPQTTTPVSGWKRLGYHKPKTDLHVDLIK